MDEQNTKPQPNREAQGGDSLPVDSLREAIPFLRRPFTPEAVRFKVQTVFKEAKGCIVVGYIDARLVIERLNRVYPEGWQARFEPIDAKTMWCHLDMKPELESDGRITRSDIGEGQGATDGMRYKAAVSDSLKRAAVHFGVGVSVYALPQITLWANAPHVEAVKGPKGPSLKLTETGHKKLREGYAKWLEEHGEDRFGKALDNGDVEGQVIDEDAEAGEEFVPEPAPALEDDQARELIERARILYENVDHRDLPPARFNAWLNGAWHSHIELQRLVSHLEQRVAA